MQGWRQGMEDAHITISDLGGEGAGISLFGVFDGHGGKQVALFCREHMPGLVLGQMAEQLQGGGWEERPEALGASMRNSFHSVDDMLREPEHQRRLIELKQEQPNVQSGSSVSSSSGSAGAESRQSRTVGALHSSIQDDLKAARGKGKVTKEEAAKLMLKMTLLKQMEEKESHKLRTDCSSGMLENAGDQVGCTAVCVAVSKTHYVCANAGDSRAVLCRGGKALELSYDHKPNNDIERRRIEAAGAVIQETTMKVGAGMKTIYRINGDLNLSRSLGDLRYKQRTDLRPEEHPVCSTPDILIQLRAPDDDFVVIACDGIWDVKTNEEVCAFILAGLQKGMAIPSIIEDLMDDCITPDPKTTGGLGADNMTCVIVQFDKQEGFPLSPSAAATDGSSPVAKEDPLPPFPGQQRRSSEERRSLCLPFRFSRRK